MDETNRLLYLQELGIQSWTLRGKETEDTILVKHATKKSVVDTEEVVAASVQPTAELNWEELQARVATCTACDLHKMRTQTVFGVGNRNADLLVVGEAPGMHEDKQGEPFVGRAGKLLNSMLLAIGLSREQVYIANVLKSRPPNNRDPKPEEVAACTPYLQRQIALIQPKLILAVGRIAAHYLLNTDQSMGNLRGQEFKYGAYATPLLITYHPAYLLRAPREKRKAWQDLMLVTKKLAQLKG